MGYELEGRMAEVCSCKTFCPCTAGLEPDNGACDFSWVFHFDRGAIDGVDVGGLSMAMVGHLDGVPGAAPGAVRLAMFVDDTSTEAQQGALLAAFGGEAGGPLAELATLVGEVVTVERVPFEFDVNEGTGQMRVGDVLKAELEALRSPDGNPTRMHDFALSPVLGRTAYHARPTSFGLTAEQHGFGYSPGSATQFEFHYSA
jgi:hypothetical protein